VVHFLMLPHETDLMCNIRMGRLGCEPDSGTADIYFSGMNLGCGIELGRGVAVFWTRESNHLYEGKIQFLVVVGDCNGAFSFSSSFSRVLGVGGSSAYCGCLSITLLSVPFLVH
jgi:hypothetical protein